jgi:fumarylacetoacetate (FAA) hydrolase
MKLATLACGGRDGTLCIVSRDLTRVVRAKDIAPTLQVAVERWTEVSGALEERYRALNEGRVSEATEFDARNFLAPLPRSYQWIDAGGYMSHMKRMRAARNAPMPERWDIEPAIYQGLSDNHLPSRADILEDPAWGVDFESELAVIVGDVAMRTAQPDVADSIRLIVLLNDVSLRKLIPAELGKGFGFFVSKPACAFAPVAITPDELGASWRDTKAVCRVRNRLNCELIGEPMAGVDQQFGFARIVEYATQTRSLIAGTIVGAGTVSNYDETVGFSCLVEKYASQGLAPQFLRPGDRLTIEAFGADDRSLFGAIDQKVRAAA